MGGDGTISLSELIRMSNELYQEMIDSGDWMTIEEYAAREGISVEEARRRTFEDDEWY